MAQSNLEKALRFLIPVLNRGPLRKEPMKGVGYKRQTPILAEKYNYA
jgi:hypothetical protein